MMSVFISWIFAKSVTNAANLGAAYGIVGGLAYATYWLSIPVAGVVIYRLRTREGATGLVSFLVGKYGRGAALAFSVAILVRLFNEVWSNTAVVGGYYGESGSAAFIGAALLFTAVVLFYSLKGGLRSSIFTDVVQAVVFLLFLGVVVAVVLPAHSPTQLLSEGSFTLAGGVDLLLVALLQVFSYPFHDPVLTDRGFISRRKEHVARLHRRRRPRLSGYCRLQSGRRACPPRRHHLGQQHPRRRRPRAGFCRLLRDDRGDDFLGGFDPRLDLLVAVEVGGAGAADARRTRTTAACGAGRRADDGRLCAARQPADARRHRHPQGDDDQRHHGHRPGADLPLLALGRLLTAVLSISPSGAACCSASCKPSNLIPTSWAIGDGKYAILLGTNLYGLALCSAAFFLPLLLPGKRLRSCENAA
jgi:hypothetical protein